MQKTKILTKLIIAVLILTAGNVLNAQEEATFETITEALEDVYVNKHEVKKLIIWGDIAGSDYSDSSEWSRFFDLDKTFPNIESIEILTDQDIPGPNFATYRNLFNDALWIKHFSAPNVLRIGDFAFIGSYVESVYFPSLVEAGIYCFSSCLNLKHIKDEDFASLKILSWCMFSGSGLVSVNFPSVEYIGEQCFLFSSVLTDIYFSEVKTIEDVAFSGCTSLVYVNLPKVVKIQYGAFMDCYSLQSISLGTGFVEETEIKFEDYVFYKITTDEMSTEDIELTLGPFVRQEPDLIENTWNYKIVWVTSQPFGKYDTLSFHTWKSINVLGIKKEKIGENIYYLGNNCYGLENVKQIELFDLLGRQLMMLKNEKIIDLNNIISGIYILKYLTDYNKIKTKKIVVN